MPTSPRPIHPLSSQRPQPERRWRGALLPRLPLLLRLPVGLALGYADLMAVTGPARTAGIAAARGCRGGRA